MNFHFFFKEQSVSSSEKPQKYHQPGPKGKINVASECDRDRIVIEGNETLFFLVGLNMLSRPSTLITSTDGLGFRGGGIVLCATQLAKMI